MAHHLTTTEIAALLRLTGSASAAKTITGVSASGGVVTVTATAHGFSAGDLLLHEAIGGAVEANGFQRVASAPNGNTYTEVGLVLRPDGVVEASVGGQTVWRRSTP